MNNQTNSRCENLEQLTFPDGTLDLFVTQDGIGHVYDPEATFQQIAGVLKPGGAHIFTVPLVNKSRATQRRASLGILESEEIVHHIEPVYHKSLVEPCGPW